MKLIIKEIIPFESPNGIINCIYERKHLVLNKYGLFKFPRRLDQDKWVSPSPIDEALNSAVQYFGITSYLIFNLVQWSKDFIHLEYYHYRIENRKEEGKLEIKEEKKTHTISIDSERLDGIEFLSLSKTYFPKATFDHEDNVTKKISMRVIGTTFEFCLSE